MKDYNKVEIFSKGKCTHIKVDGIELLHIRNVNIERKGGGMPIIHLDMICDIATLSEDEYKKEMRK